MAKDKVIRQARQFADKNRGDGGGSTTMDELESAYELPPQKVDFPWFILVVAIICDVIDIFVIFSGPAAVVYFFVVVIILLPAELWYVKQREEKYSSYKVSGETQLRGINKLKKLKTTEAQAKRIGANIKALEKAGKTAQSAKAAANLKRILPPWLKYLTAIADKIPFIQVIPGNTALILLSYYDNVATVKAIRAGLETMAKRPEFKITRVAGSNR